MSVLVSNRDGIRDATEKPADGVQQVQVAKKLYGIFEQALAFQISSEALLGGINSKEELAKRHSLLRMPNADTDVSFLNFRLCY